MKYKNACTYNNSLYKTPENIDYITLYLNAFISQKANYISKQLLGRCNIQYYIICLVYTCAHILSIHTLKIHVVGNTDFVV